MKIALYIPTLMAGGAEKVMINLANEFALSHEVDLIVATNMTPLGHLVAPRVNLISLGAKGVVFSLPLLVGHLIKNRYDVLVSALDYANIIALLAGAITKTPVIISEHSTASLSLHHSPSRKARLIGWLIKQLYPMAKKVVAVSHGVKSDLTKIAPTCDVTTIYNPVLKTIPPLEREKILHPFFDASNSVIIAAGRLTRPKNFPLLLESFALLLCDTPQAKLIILGEGEERGALEELVKKRGIEKSVDLVGFVDDPISWFGMSDLFVLSSSWEGLGNVLIEALAAGCSVVSTRCPSGPEEILEGGKWGRLVTMDDPKALRKAIKEGLSSPKTPPPSEFFEQFTMSFSAQKYLALCQEVTNEKR